MNQDVNKILDVVGAEWAGSQAQTVKRVAILTEHNDRLQKEIEQLKGEIEELKSDKPEGDKE